MAGSIIAFLLQTRLGRGLLVALCIIAAGGVIYLAGRHDQARKAEIAAIEAKLATARADTAIANALAGIAEDETRAAERAAAATQDQINGYEKALAERPDARCALGSDDVRRLRALNPAP